MSREILKWLAALGVGALSAALAYVSGHIGTGPGEISPAIAGLIVFVLTRVVNYLTSKVPAKPNGDEPEIPATARRSPAKGI